MSDLVLTKKQKERLAAVYDVRTAIFAGEEDVSAETLCITAEYILTGNVLTPYMSMDLNHNGPPVGVLPYENGWLTTPSGTDKGGDSS